MTKKVRRRAPVPAADVDAAADALRAELLRRGLMPLHDASLPSVTTAIAGAPIAGSWFAHAKGPLIFEVLSRLEADVVTARLVAGRETLVFRDLWPALVAACREQAPWQLEGLHGEARALLARIERTGHARTDRLRETMDGRVVGQAVAALERRLLVVGAQIHGDDGAPARELSSWSRWQQRAGLAHAPLPSAQQARVEIEAQVDGLGPGARETLPWGAGAR